MAEELLLLLLDEIRGEFSNVPDRILGYALAGAALMDLSLEDRIDSDPSTLILLDATPRATACWIRFWPTSGRSRRHVRTCRPTSGCAGSQAKPTSCGTRT